MVCDRRRWNWLLESYNVLTGDQHDAIIKLFSKDRRGISDDVLLEEAMLEVGAVILGTDPNPPKRVPVTDAGAEEYDEIMLYYNDDL